MAMIDMVLVELEQEVNTTRTFLERLPEDKLGWKPHEKSMSAGQLALHIANIPGAISAMANEDQIPPPNFDDAFPAAESRQQILETLDAGFASAKDILAGFTDARMDGDWKVVAEDGTTVLEMPRSWCVRSILLNHLIHHRGQFGVYLRLLGASVPSAYGPSGDELPEFMKAAAP